MYWQVGSSATLGTTTTFAGNILVVDEHYPGYRGNHFVRQGPGGNGAVTLDSNTIDPPAPVASPLFAVRTGPGTCAQVNVYNAQTGVLEAVLNPFTPNFTGGVRVATGDVNGDGFTDIIVGAGPGGGPQVEVYDGQTFPLIRSFDAFAPSFSGGVYVEAGDLLGNGYADIIVGADAGGGPQVTVLDGTSGELEASFDAFAASFTGGVRVSLSGSTSLGHPAVLVGTGPGGGPVAATFDDATLALLSSFYAFDPAYSGGVFVG